MHTTLGRAAAILLVVAWACGGSTSTNSGGSGSGGGSADAGSGSGGGGGSADAGSGSGGGGGGSADAGSGSGGGGDADGGGSGGGGGPPPALTVLAAGENPSAIAINGDNVYWINKDLDVRTVSKQGGAVSTITHAGASPIFMLADEVAVYWTANGTYWRAPLAGGAPGAIDTALASSFFGSDDTTAYYEKYNGSATSIVIAHRARDGSGSVTINSSAGRYGGGGVTIGPGSVFWVSIGGMSMTGDFIMSVPANGTTVTQVAALGSGQFAAGPIKYNDGKIFYRTQDGVFSVPADGGTPTRLANAANARVPALDANSSVAYWNDNCLASSAKGCIDTGGSSYGSVKVDGTYVYFDRGGDVMRLSK